jgi:hypothetical protein
MKKTANFVSMCLISSCLTVAASASEYDILRPGGVQNDLDVKEIRSVKGKMLASDNISNHELYGPHGSHGIIDTLTWRSKAEPDVNFGFLNHGDSLLIWFQPAAACSLIAIRFRPINWQGSTLHHIWNASGYDTKISSPDSVDANGWIGTFEPIMNPGGWISGLWDHSPLGGSHDDPEHLLWGPFPYTVVAEHANLWVEIPAALGIQGETDLGRDPFYIGSVFYITNEWGFCAEHAWRTSYTFFKFYSAGTGPDDVHDGWFIRSYFMWFEAVVKYYENTPPSIKSIKSQNDTYDSGPFPITVTITDNDAEDETRAGVASAELVYDINGVVDRTTMEGPPDGGLFTANILDVAVGDTVTYWIEATDTAGLWSQSKKVTFTRIEPLHPSADILVIWDSEYNGAMDTFYVDLFSNLGSQYEFEPWNVSQRNGIDASVVNWGWNTIYVAGWMCRHTLPGRDYIGNLFVDWLESGTTAEPHNLLYFDQDYFCAHSEYGCDWEGELTEGDFLHDYCGVAAAISDNYGASIGGYDSVAIGLGDYENIRVNFLPDAWDPTGLESNLRPDWLIDLTEEAEYIFRYADPPFGTGFGAGVRLDRGYYRTVFLPWQDFFAVDSLENSDLVARPGLIATIEKILEWFGTSTTISYTQTETIALQNFYLYQNYPNPFNTTTDIRYQIPESSSTTHSTLKVYNILGQEVRTLVNGEQESGQYIAIWDGHDENGVEVPSGVYFYQLRSGTSSYTRKMLLLK